MPSCSASDWYSISTWILVRQEVNTVPEMRAHLEPALALIYPNPCIALLPAGPISTSVLFSACGFAHTYCI